MIHIYPPEQTDFTYNGTVIFPTECKITSDTQGKNALSLKMPDSDLIKENAIICVPSYTGPDQLYRLYNPHRSSAGTVTASGKPIFMDSADEILLVHKEIKNAFGQSALNALLAGQSKYQAITDITKTASAEYEQKNLMEALNGTGDESFANRWGAEIEYDNYTLRAMKRLGADRGMRIAAGHNLTAITVKTLDTDLQTVLIPVGYNNFVCNSEVTSPHVNEYPKKYKRILKADHIVLKADASADQLEDKSLTICETETAMNAALRAYAQQYFIDTGCDQIQREYTVDFVDLRKSPDYAKYKDLLKVSLGDTVHVEDLDMGIDVDARVLSLVYNCVSEKVESITLGQYSQRYFSGLQQMLNTSRKVFDSANHLLNGLSLSGVVNTKKAQSKSHAKGSVRVGSTRQSIRSRTAVSENLEVANYGEHDITWANNDGGTFRQLEVLDLIEDTDPNSMSFGAIAKTPQGFLLSQSYDEETHQWDWSEGTALNARGLNGDVLRVGLIQSMDAPTAGDKEEAMRKYNKTGAASFEDLQTNDDWIHDETLFNALCAQRGKYWIELETGRYLLGDGGLFMGSINTRKNVKVGMNIWLDAFQGEWLDPTGDERSVIGLRQKDKAHEDDPNEWDGPLITFKRYGSESSPERNLRIVSSPGAYIDLSSLTSDNPDFSYASNILLHVDNCEIKLENDSLKIAHSSGAQGEFGNNHIKLQQGAAELDMQDGHIVLQQGSAKLDLFDGKATLTNGNAILESASDGITLTQGGMGLKLSGGHLSVNGGSGWKEGITGDWDIDGLEATVGIITKVKQADKDE